MIVKVEKGANEYSAGSRTLVNGTQHDLVNASGGTLVTDPTATARTDPSLLAPTVRLNT